MKKLILATLIALCMTPLAHAQAAGPNVGPGGSFSFSMAPEPVLGGFEARICTTQAGCSASATATPINLGLLSYTSPVPPSAAVTLTVPISALGSMPSGQKFLCIRAYNAAGSSSCSNEAPFVFVTGPPTQGPTNLIVR